MNNSESQSSISNELRRNRREKFKEHQEFNRLKAFESNRFVDSEIITEKDICGLCSRIKRRKHATAEDLTKLSNAFIQSEANIRAFIKTTGAINVLVKEFTGLDKAQQLLAAHCLCNLSLGDDSCCSKVATFAGSYLMIIIMSSDASLAKICLWTSQNIIAAGSKSMEILMSQELLKNCLQLLCNSAEQEREALQLLEIIIDRKLNELKLEEQIEVHQSVVKMMKKSSEDVLVLQCFCKLMVLNAQWSTNSEETIQLLTMVVVNISKPDPDEQVLYFSIKILEIALKQYPNFTAKLIELLVQSNVNLVEIINRAAEIPKLFGLVNDLMQLLSYLYLHPSAADIFPIEALRIPKLFVF